MPWVAGLWLRPSSSPSGHLALTSIAPQDWIRELQATLSAGTIALEISSRNSRVAALQNRWDRLRAGLALVLDQRGADMAEVPGGASGFPSKTSRARIVTLWVSERSPQGCWPRLQADAGARRVSLR